MDDAGHSQFDNAIEFEFAAERGLVSVVIPTYNRANRIAQAIDSVLAQSYPSLEVVVVDDGSTDDTRRVVSGYDARVRYYYQSNAGVAQARNTGIARSRGEFIAFLDSDDAWHPWKTEAEVAALAAHPEAGLVWTDMTAINPLGRVVHDRYLRRMYGGYKDVDVERLMHMVAFLGDFASVSPELAVSPVRKGDLSDHILLGNVIHTSTVLYRRAWAERAGGLNRTWTNGGEDYEYYTRLCALGPVILIDAPSVFYQVGGADQLTAPEHILAIARNNLRTVRARFAERQNRVPFPQAVVRRRLSWSLEWVGYMEFDAGHRVEAARHLVRSLRVRPGIDRRALLLAACALPPSAVEGLRAIRHLLWR